MTRRKIGQRPDSVWTWPSASNTGQRQNQSTFRTLSHQRTAAKRIYLGSASLETVDRRTAAIRSGHPMQQETEVSREKFFDKNVPAGKTVIWYPQGRLSPSPHEANGPCVAIVARCEGGVCDLHVFNHRSQVVSKKSVYHHSHPDSLDPFGQPTGRTINDGTWGFCEGESWETYGETKKLVAAKS